MAALLAGFVVMPAIFAAGISPVAGPGLTFVALPSVFAAIPAGAVFGTLFFVLLAIAALTSAVSILEPIVSYLIDEHGVRRGTATALTALIAYLLSIPSSLSLGPWDAPVLFGLGFMDLLDRLTSTIMLPLGGLLIAVFVGWVMGPRAVDELGEERGALRGLARLWLAFVRYVAPLAIGWILISGLFA